MTRMCERCKYLTKNPTMTKCPICGHRVLPVKDADFATVTEIFCELPLANIRRAIDWSVKWFDHPFYVARGLQTHWRRN